jgi:hypothetical protein
MLAGMTHHFVFFAEVRQEAVAAETAHARRVLTPEHAAAADLDVLAKVAVPARRSSVRRRTPFARGSMPLLPHARAGGVGGASTCGGMLRAPPAPPHPPSASRLLLRPTPSSLLLSLPAPGTS